MEPLYVLSACGRLYGTPSEPQIRMSHKWRQQFRNVGQDKCVAQAGLLSKARARVGQSFMFHYRLSAAVGWSFSRGWLPKSAVTCRKVSSAVVMC